MAENENKKDKRRKKWRKKKQNTKTTSNTEPESSKPTVSIKTKESRPKQIGEQRRKELPHDAFKPRNKSTNNTHLKNDPLNVGAVLINGFHILKPSPRIPFHIDCSQFFTIIRDTYVHLTRDKVFKQTISLTMFAYYCVILSWNCIIYVLSEKERSRTWSENFKRSLLISS